MSTEKLKALEGRLVKVVYRDIDHDSVVKGNLIRVDDDFIELHSFRNSYIIRRDQILKIVSPLGHNDWAAFAESCPHRVGDLCDNSICNYHESSPGTCSHELCSLWERRGIDHGAR